MRFRFKSMLFFIVVLFLCCSAVGIGYFFYKEVFSSSDIIVDGDLTINYLNGRNFNLKGNQTIEFSVTNNSDNQEFYYIQLTDASGSDVKYNLKSSSNLDIHNDLTADVITNQVAINSNETVNYSMTFETNADNEYSGTIQIGRKINNDNTFIDVLLSNNAISNTTLTEIGDIATLEEGLIPMQDETGLAYFFRGNINNNNVKFAGYNWKIVKINGDSSIKLVLDSVIPSLSKYYDKDIEYTETDIKKALDYWFSENLNGYSEYIAYHKYCNDNILEEDNTNYIAYTRLIKNKIPTYMCLGVTSNDKIGLLTADEVMLAGATNKANKEYYLYNESIETAYYTMTLAKYQKDVYYPFVVNTDGSLVDNVSGTLLRGIRPVINIVRNAQVTGNGTIENPYEISLN